MRYHNITKDDMLNGDGLRVVLWTAGCSIAVKNVRIPLPGTQMEASLYRSGGRQRYYAELDKDYISGITFSGGDPLHPANISGVTALAKEIKEKYPDKTIWLYTGALWEEIQNEEIVRYLDVCIDGEFQVDKKELSLKWRGSSNQRIIEVPATLREGRVVLKAD